MNYNMSGWGGVVVWMRRQIIIGIIEKLFQLMNNKIAVRGGYMAWMRRKIIGMSKLSLVDE